ncbi:MAG: class I SAM-dependent methyltransferase [Sedimentisphaerales bacterium]|nr:class I SAM-dependent methyltransferase [Sedimentisphaerales bacterium]
MDKNNKLPPFFYEIFAPSLPRLGPGNAFSTNKALDTLLPRCSAQTERELAILDLGCGNGCQTIQLAQRLNAKILAVDNHQPFLDELARRAKENGVADKIQPHLADSRCLDLAAGSFDLIWCEGAIFTIGFRKALELFHDLLKPSGLAAFSEMAWLRPGAPQKCVDFITGPCPDLADISSQLSTIAETGFGVLDHFILDESAWWENFYQPLSERAKQLRKEHDQDAQKKELLDFTDLEIEMHREFSQYYGYVFYMIERQ